MRTSVAVVAAALTFLLGAYVSPTLHSQERQEPRVWGEADAPKVYVPDMPKVGDRFWIGRESCRVVHVAQEWVKCGRESGARGDDTWLNLYTGAQHSVIDVPREP